MKDINDKSNNILTFAEQVEIEFLRLYELYKVADAPARQIPNKIDAIWSAIYDIVFKPMPEDIRHNNANTKIKTWDIESMEAVVKKFIDLNRLYGGIVKHGSFEDLTGINKQTFLNWHKDNKTDGYIFPLSDHAIQYEYNNIFIHANKGQTLEYYGKTRLEEEKRSGRFSPMRFDIWKKLQDSMQDSNTNSLSLDTMGSMFRANQEPELGRMYEPKRMMMQEQAKRVIAAADLPKLDGKSTGKALEILD